MKNPYSQIVSTNRPKIDQYINTNDIVYGLPGSDLHPGERARVLYIREDVQFTQDKNEKVSEFWAAIQVIKSSNPHAIGLKLKTLASGLRRVD